MIESESAKSVLIIHDVLPHFDESGSDLRILQVIRCLCDFGYAVSYIARDGKDRDRYEEPLKALGVKVFANDAVSLRTLGVDINEEWRLEEVLQASQFHVAILFHWFWNSFSVTEQYLDKLRRLSPGTRIVILTDDRHWVRQFRLAQISVDLADYVRALDFRNREIECYRSADLVVVISKTERIELLNLLPEIPLEILPMSFDRDDDAKCSCRRTGFVRRQNFLFLGNFTSPANLDAAQWFCDDIWPGIKRRLPQAEFHLAGHGANPEMIASDGVKVLGHVPNLEVLLCKYRVFVSPLRIGTGIKTKNVIAMSHGLPLVTTAVGAEGMDLCDGENAMIANTKERFIEAASRLYSNRELWETIRRQGIQHIKAAFSNDQLRASLQRIMKRVKIIYPQSFNLEHRFSMIEVEDTHSTVIDHQPASMRVVIRIWAHAERAGQYLTMHRPDLARDELFHAVSLMSPLQLDPNIRAMLFGGIERCSYDLGEVAFAAWCAQEADRLIREKPSVQENEG